MTIQAINPADNTIVKEYKGHNPAEIEIILNASHKAFLSWKKISLEERSKLMRKAANYLREQKQDLGKLMVNEMGKPVKQAIAEAEKCAWVCDFYADKAHDFLKDEMVKSDAGESFVCYEPLGAILAIMPWNFPFWQVFRFAAPALMAGNTAILKHASNVPGCALAIEQIFKESGFPAHVFQTVLCDSKQVADIIQSPVVKAVTLTGSEGAGAAVASLAGKEIKKSVLELGGSDPFIVLKDADIEQAAEVAVQSRMINSGQSCIAAKRFIVEEAVYDEFLKRLAERVRNIKVGDPMDESTEVGPMAREDLAEEIMRQIKDSVQKGAEVIVGGDRPEMKGAYVNPTILVNVKPGVPAYEEEIFGPVASVIKVKNTDEAITVANDSRFGLGASLWTNDIKKAATLARQIESGSVFVNGMVKSDPRLPFGGIKKSGFGRELSYQGIREFVNIKTIWIK